MTVRGHIQNGQIVLDEPVRAPDGTPVTVEFSQVTSEPTTSAPATEGKTVWDVLLELAGSAGPGLPADFADEHDHYIHGTPKRNGSKSTVSPTRIFSSRSLIPMTPTTYAPASMPPTVPAPS
jgi:hypothetical protein